MKKIDYTIEKADNKYIVWKNVEIKKEQKGSCGSYKLYKGTLKKCKEHAKKHRLKIKRNSTLLLKFSV